MSFGGDAWVKACKNYKPPDLGAELDCARLLLADAERENERLQAVVDAVREKCRGIISDASATIEDEEAGYEQLYANGQYETAEEILRALDGEVKP